jgi:adenylate cyclase
MAADERATVTALDAARAVFREQIESSRGRVIDMAGDSVLAVFETATGAVSAALSIQQRLTSLCADVPDERRMRFRVGVHLGDVIEKADGTVYGDGVNIAARLQGLAEPGGITVSESIRTAVKGKVTASFDDQGAQQVKNIADPVRVYRVGPEGSATPTPTLAAGETNPSLPDRPSITVLPFTNMSGDPEQEYFADGMVEDIVTELSRFQRLFVIARNTSFTYKGRGVEVRKVARELGVHFVLEGSVRRAGNRVRITAQLIDGETGRHVWAERYEDVLSDVFELQERITRQIVGSMVTEIEAEEMRLLERGQRRFTEADDTSWRAAKAWTDGVFNGQPALTIEAIRLAEQAIEQDRNCRLAWYVLSRSHSVRVFFAWTQDRAGSIEAARRAAEVLMTLAPNDSRSYFQRGRAPVREFCAWGRRSTPGARAQPERRDDSVLPVMDRGFSGRCRSGEGTGRASASDEPKGQMGRHRASGVRDGGICRAGPRGPSRLGRACHPEPPVGTDQACADDRLCGGSGRRVLAAHAPGEGPERRAGFCSQPVPGRLPSLPQAGAHADAAG